MAIFLRIYFLGLPPPHFFQVAWVIIFSKDFQSFRLLVYTAFFLMRTADTDKNASQPQLLKLPFVLKNVKMTSHCKTRMLNIRCKNKILIQLVYAQFSSCFPNWMLIYIYKESVILFFLFQGYFTFIHLLFST